MQALKIGHGYDVHELVTNRDLIIGGVKIPYEKDYLVIQMQMSYYTRLQMPSLVLWVWEISVMLFRIPILRQQGLPRQKY